ncbi:uncharacterized protein LOC124280483 isoform X3 [Haliotis rubra]|uniref:uncharacterized protein LOC124280483 isoform X3 n=1 Tax=Haliotis rubra TaxID=36100 RepID=UPI001EE53B9A|nr:uncharacterized protein LOC124280483 isoform X3 [Haliotis rubra]
MDTKILTKVPTENSLVWGIAIDTRNKKLFLAFATKITMMNYDGSDYVTLLNKKNGNHFGMMFDMEGHRLYYADSSVLTLGSLDLETNVTTVYRNDTLYLSVHEFEGVLYAGPFGDRGTVDVLPGGCGPRSYVYFNTSIHGGIRATVFRIYGCPSGWYGRLCTRECGKCFNGSACDNIDGHCADGCDTGWIGDTCTTDWNLVVWALVSVCVFLGLVVVVLVILLVRCRRMVVTNKQKKIGVTAGAVRNPTYQDDTGDAGDDITSVTHPDHVYEKMDNVQPPVYETLHA